MPGRETLAAIGHRRGRRLVADFGERLREARLAAGFSRSALATVAGVSVSKLARWERAEPPYATLHDVAIVMRLLGLDFVTQFYPAGNGLRDAAHARVVAEFLALLGRHVRRQLEAPMPLTADLRAWDVLVELGTVRMGVAVETRLRDWQALLRREEQKARDSGVDRLLLVLLDSHANRLAVAEAGPALRAALPLDGRAILPALRAGRDPGASGIIFVGGGK